MNIQQNHPIPNTLQVHVKAKYLVDIKSVQDLDTVYADPDLNKLPIHILGTGSNTLFTQDFPGVVFRMQIKGKYVVNETQSDILLKFGAGEDWPNLVTYTVENNWGGIENLALIPGTVGAAPIQNIAAYGQNFEDTFESLEAYDVHTHRLQTFNRAECKFGYRDSYFKQAGKNKYVITSVTLKLSKRHQLETNYFSIGAKYESITSELEKIAQPPYTIKDVYLAVTNIRTRQLPDWQTTPTAGSFFKNPLISKEKYQQLQSQIPELQAYPADQLTYKQLNDEEFNKSKYVKVPTGRLLDFLGWKGKQVGNVTTFPNHALIVTHNGQASGKEILSYVKAMQTNLKQELDIDIEPEINII